MATKKNEKVGAATKAVKPVPPVSAEAVQPVIPEVVVPKKFLGTLGSKRIISISKKIVGGVEYNEIVDEACSTFLLSDRDLKTQLKPLE